MKDQVWVECVGSDIRPVRIFKNFKAIPLEEMAVYLMDRRDAVGSIRHQIFVRQEGHCDKCNEIVTEQQMHLHEKIFRSKGGEISLDNSIGLCASCHEFGPDAEHRNRKPRFTRKESK